MCLLFETICVLDGKPQHLHYHQLRMRNALTNLFAEHAQLQRLIQQEKCELLNIDSIISEMQIPISGKFKIKIVYSTQLEESSFQEYAPRNANSFQLVNCDNINYSHKFSDRSLLNSLFSQRGVADDVIIVKNGCIADTSIANIVFFDGKNLITPIAPILAGTHRARLIDEGIVKLGIIRPKDLNTYESFFTINAMSLPEPELIPICHILM